MNATPPADEAAAIAPFPAVERPLGHFDNRELSTLALLAALHFAASFASNVSGSLVAALAGPAHVFVSGLTGEGLPSLLLATAVVLVPKVGAATYSIAVVWLLNAVVTGTFSVVSTAMVAVSIVVHELLLGLLGVTLESPWRRPSAVLRAVDVVRTSAAVGLANGAALYAQFAVSRYFYDFRFDAWYVHAVALVTGVGYGSLGAAVGAAWGFQLRKTSP